jgi:hypothetical protein
MEGSAMKATLEFNLPEETCEFKLASNACEMHSALWAIRNDLRSKSKHGHTFKNAEELLDFMYQFVIDEMAGLPDVE